MIAIQNFFLKENPSKAKVVITKRNDDGTWKSRDLFNLPLVHRIGIIKDDDKAFLIACTIAQSKETKDDWSKPGEIWYCELPQDDSAVELKLLKSNLFHNHGFYQYRENGTDVIYVGTSNGCFKLYRENKEFKLEKILSGAIGEIAVCDIDNDGLLELMTIEPFHGDSIKIYHLINGCYQEVWRYSSKVDFAHALIGGMINNSNCFIAGVRKENAEIFIVTIQNGEYHVDLFDEHVGSANLSLVNHHGQTYISSANHSTNECALYKISN